MNLISFSDLSSEKPGDSPLLVTKTGVPAILFHIYLNIMRCVKFIHGYIMSCIALVEIMV